MFKVNEGPSDRVARIIVGVVFLFLAFYLSGGLQILLFVLAAICLFTAVTGFCGIYALFKCNTLPKVDKIVTMPTTEATKPIEEKNDEPKEEELIEEKIATEEIKAKADEAEEEETQNPMNIMTDPETDEAPETESEEETADAESSGEPKEEEADEEPKTKNEEKENDEEEPIKL